MKKFLLASTAVLVFALGSSPACAADEPGELPTAGGDEALPVEEDTALSVDPVASATTQAEAEPAVPPSIAVVAAPPRGPAIADLLAGMRVPYNDYRWRIPVVGGVDSALLGVQYRCWGHSGIGLALDGAMVEPGAQGRGREELAGYGSTILALEYWKEWPSSVVPFMVGMRMSAGVMVTNYTADLKDGGNTVIASAGGLGAGISLYVTIPVFSYLWGHAKSAWWPHLQWETGYLFELIGKMENSRDCDLDGDGVVDHVKGERFSDSAGKVLKGAIISVPRVGWVWIF